MFFVEKLMHNTAESRSNHKHTHPLFSTAQKELKPPLPVLNDTLELVMEVWVTL